MTQTTSNTSGDATTHWRGWSAMTPTLRLANFYDAEPGGGFGPRFITEYQLVFVQRGSGEAVVDDKLYPLSPGDVLYYGPNQQHEVVSSKSQPLRLLGLVWVYNQDDVGRLPDGHRTLDRPYDFADGAPNCPLDPPPPTHCSPGIVSPMARACESLVLSYISSPDSRAMEKRGLLLVMFEAWADAIANLPRQASGSPLHRRMVERAQKRIIDSLANPPSRAELAKEAWLSPTHFARIFKAHSGLSVRAFINQQRLAEAQRLLVEGTLNVAEVAQAVGFEDPFYFSRVFSQTFGIPPSELRKRQSMV